MAQLLYGTEVLGGFPDNVNKLIQPLDLRNFVVSAKDGVGSYEMGLTPVDVPIDPDLWININSLLTGVTQYPGLWRLDANNYAISNYDSLPNTTVPPGYKKRVEFRANLLVDKVGGGTDEYQFQFSRNGSPLGQPMLHYFTGSPESLTLFHSEIVDISDLSAVYGLQVKGIATGDDFSVVSMNFSVRDSWLMEEPV